jgi:hypothetical protein
MSHTPFTLEEANEIREDFEDLVDTEFSLSGPAVFLVHDVLVCPYHEADKQLYTAIYSQTKDSQKASGAYHGSGYDVVLAASGAEDEASYVYINIREFAAEKGVNYHFPGDAS